MMSTISRTPLTTTAKVPLRAVNRTAVNARTVAAYLGIKETTVYTLIRGIRGWQRIEALPHIEHPDESRRERYSFSSTTSPRGGSALSLRCSLKGEAESVATRKKPISAKVLELSRQAQALSALERRTLILLIRNLDQTHPRYTELDSAFVVVLRTSLRHHNERCRNEIDCACDILEEALEPLTDKRERAAVLATVLRAASVELLNKNQPVNVGSLLFTLNTQNWTELINNLFPGYSLRLLGKVLCQSSLTSPASSLQTA